MITLREVSMGREARVIRVRVCPFCDEGIYGDARDQQEHTDLCSRMKALGLITPDLVVPPELVGDRWRGTS